MLKMNNNVLLYLFSVLIASIGQTFLKRSAMESHINALFEYLNFKVIFGYTLFFASTFITILAYENLPLSIGPVMELSGFVYITLIGKFYFNESIRLNKYIGLIFITIGILIISL